MKNPKFSIPLVFLSFVLILLGACKEDVTPKSQYRIVSVKTNALAFDELIKPVDFFETNQIQIVYNLNFSNRIFIRYNDKLQIVSTAGGLATAPNSTNSGILTFTDDIKDTILYVGDTIITKIPTFSTGNPDLTKMVVKDNKLVFRQVKRNTLSYSEYNYNYTYLADRIIETMNGLQTGIYYLTENNLTKVEKFAYDSNNTILKKTEILFSGYDKSLNLLKGYFYINGAFYIAFSENNHNKMIVKNYTLENNQLTLNSTYQDTITYQLNSANIPDLFDFQSN